MATLEAIRYNAGVLTIVDQLQLPHTTLFIPIDNVQDAWDAIRQMKVRGAPAIAIVAALAVAVDLQKMKFENVDDLHSFVVASWTHLKTSRPTAVNLFRAADTCVALSSKLRQESANVHQALQQIIAALEIMFDNDIADNKNIGRYGAEEVMFRTGKTSGLRMLTHCNTGSLATAGYGTALGVCRSLHAAGAIERVYCTETRPYNQGARLTAFELVFDKIPSMLVTDSMCAALMRVKGVDAVVVGADRVVANGDTANKIGTYQLAVLARHHGIPFYIAAPTTTVDLSLASGDQIIIEERPANELTHIAGVALAAPGIECWNPSFDVTPASLITAIITEIGVAVREPNSDRIDMAAFVASGSITKSL